MIFTCGSSMSDASVQSNVQGGMRALEMVSAKSSLGHAEAAAGALGITRTINWTQSQSVAPLTHLRILNPHVIAILESNFSKCIVDLPRQVAPGGIGGSICSGISSFAFQVRNGEMSLFTYMCVLRPFYEFNDLC